MTAQTIWHCSDCGSLHQSLPYGLCPDRDKLITVGESKLAAYLEQENAVLHERVRKLEADQHLRARDIELALWNIRAIAAQEQEQPSGLHMTAFSLIQKYATQALRDEDLP